MEKLLIVGVECLAGANLALSFSERFEILGVARRPCELDGSCEIHLSRDLSASVPDIAARTQPNWTIYCGPTSSSRWDWVEPAEVHSEHAHVATAQRAAADCGSFFTLISSDALVTGPQLFHNELSAAASRHGAAVAARGMEQSLNDTPSLIIRTHLFGCSPAGDSFAERLWSAMASGRLPGASGAVYSTPILATDFAKLLYQAYRRQLTGLYNLGGAERTSAWQFATALATVAGVSGKVTPLSVDVPQFSRTCHDETSLDSRKIQRTLSMALPSLRDGLQRFIEQQVSGYGDRMIGASEADSLTAFAA